MEDLIKAVDTTPIIDHHAHNLLTASDIDAHEMMAITTEADGPALEQTSSTLAHLRAVKGLAQILKCEPNWDAVQKAIQSRREGTSTETLSPFSAIRLAFTPLRSEEVDPLSLGAPPSCLTIRD